MNEKMDPKKILTIIIGGDPDADDRELFENPEKAINKPRHTLYLNSYEELQRTLSPSNFDQLRWFMNYRPYAEKQGALNKQKESPPSNNNPKNPGRIKFSKNGRSRWISTPFESIQILFAQKT
jgi:predicted transcriptional regulator